MLTPESVTSRWVRHEIDYFNRARGPKDTLVIRRRPCEVPASLAGAELIDWLEADDGERPEARLLGFLRPEAGGGYVEYDHRKSVRKAWTAAQYAQPEGFDPTPTDENSRLLDLLLFYDINDLAEEGPALVGFDRVGGLLAEVDATEMYGAKMVLGEFIALAILRDRAYSQVASRYVRRDVQSRPSFLTLRNRALRGKTGAPSTTNLLHAVARCGSKLAEIDPARIDLSTMGAVLHNLDQRPTLAGHEKAVAMMVGRTLGKLRGTDIVDALIHTLVRWGGGASHIAAATAISASYDSDDALVYYTNELAELARDPQTRPSVRRPSESIARLLLDSTSRLWAIPAVCDDVQRSHDDFVQSFGSDWPLGTGLWPELRYAPVPKAIENGPLVGTIRRVTIANMETFADTLGATDLACLTEPRIVDALLDGASGYLIDKSETDAPLGQRLRNRGARFATFDRAGLDRLEGGAVVVLWPGGDGDGGAWGFAVGPR